MKKKLLIFFALVIIVGGVGYWLSIDSGETTYLSKEHGFKFTHSIDVYVEDGYFINDCGENEAYLEIKDNNERNVVARFNKESGCADEIRLPEFSTQLGKIVLKYKGEVKVPGEEEEFEVVYYTFKVDDNDWVVIMPRSAKDTNQEEILDEIMSTVELI